MVYSHNMKRKVQSIVLEGLQKYPATRNSDKMLVWYVYGVLGLIDSGNLSKKAFLDPKTPSGDTITRCRRKLVEEHPELDADPEVKALRDKLELEKGGHVLKAEVDTKLTRKFRFEGNKAIEYWE